MSAALSIGVMSLAGANGCTCVEDARFVVDPTRCSVLAGAVFCVCPPNDGCLNVGGRVRPAFDGVRPGAGVFGNSPGVGRSGVTGGYDILLSTYLQPSRL